MLVSAAYHQPTCLGAGSQELPFGLLCGGGQQGPHAAAPVLKRTPPHETTLFSNFFLMKEHLARAAG